MFKQKRLTVLSMAVVLALLAAAVMPLAAFADDGAPPPPDVPVVDVPPTESVSDVVAALAEANAVLLDADGNPIPLASQEAAEALSTGDPSGTLDDTVAADDYGLTTGATFSYLQSDATDEDQQNGDCIVTGNSVTCYWNAPLQQAINDAAAASTITVEAGTYAEDVIINKSLSIEGAGLATIINGQSGGYGAALTIAAHGVTISGLNVNGAGIAALWLNTGVSGANVHANFFTSAFNQTAVTTQGNQQGSIFTGNTFTGNAASQLVYVNGEASLGQPSDNIDFVGNTFNGTIVSGGVVLGIESTNSDVTDNIFEDTLTSTYAIVETWESDAVFHDNSFEGTESIKLLNSDASGTVNASGNWWGTTDPAAVAASTSGSVDYTPWLDNGADHLADPGFQGDFSVLNVDDDSPQSGGTGPIQEAINLVSSGGTVNVMPGTYDEGNDPITINKSLTLLGPNAGISPNGGIREPEAVLTSLGLGLAPQTIVSIEGTPAMVTIKGFMFDGSEATAASNLTSAILSYWSGIPVDIEKNIFANINYDPMYFEAPPTFVFDDNLLTNLGDVEALQMGGNYNGVSGTTVTITNNVWENSQSTGMNMSSVSGTIADNQFTNIQYYAILLANQTGNLAVSDNIFDGVSNPAPGETSTWGAGVRFYEPDFSGPVNITGNVFSNSYMGLGVRSGSDITGMSIDVHSNTFTGNIIGIRNAGTGTLDAEKNWWGDATGPSGAGSGSGDAVSANVDFTPWYATDTTMLSTEYVSVDHPGSSIIALSDTIQGGVYAANSGDTVNMVARDYTEDVNINDKDGFTLQGAGSGDDGTLIEGSVHANENTGTLTLNDFAVTGSTGNGVDVNHNGLIVLMNLDSSGNGDSGAWLNNCLQDETGACTNTDDVSVTNSVFDGNDHHGLDVATGGTLLLTSVTANYNGQAGDFGAGLSVCNYFVPDGADPEDGYCQNTAASVTIEGTTNVFNNNEYNGIEIFAAGPISLTNITANNNEGGAWLDASGAVTVSDSQFSDNTWGGFGAASPTGPVMLTNVVATGNGGDGIDIYTDGNVTLNSATITGNSYDGVYVVGYDNSTWPPNDWAGTVIVNGGTFTGNGDGAYSEAYGLDIYACQLSTDGAQTFGGNQTANVFFEQNPACVPADEPTPADDPTPDDGTTTISGTTLSPILIPVTGGEQVALNTTASTTLQLPGGNQVSFDPGVGDAASVTTETEASLPGVLPAGNTFASAMTVSVMNGGVPVTQLPAGVTIEVSFVIPPLLAGQTIALLYFDPTLNGGLGGWVEVPATVTPEGNLVASVSFVGTFALVVK